MGLAGLALQAGSKSAIGSLWYVDDLLLRILLTILSLFESWMSKSTALTQTARLRFRKNQD